MNNYTVKIEKAEIFTTKKIKINKLKGLIYIIKYKYMDDNNWYVGISGLHNSNTKIVDNNQEYTIFDNELFEERTIDGFISSFISKMEEYESNED